MKVLLTGSAGFIGAAVGERLLARGDQVIGVDNLDPYYDVKLKRARLARLTNRDNFIDVRANIADDDVLAGVFSKHRP